MLLCRLLIFFFKINVFKNYFSNTIRVSNRLDPDQVRQYVRPDLGSNCLQRLLADDTGRQKIKASSHYWYVYMKYMVLSSTLK